jgi:predicted  nucleic acid-binding Zn-ribbon protein
MEEITWPVAISALGTLVVIATFMFKWFSKDQKPWTSDLQKTEDELNSGIRNLEHRTTVSEGKQQELIRRVNELKDEVKAQGETSEKKIEKIEEKVEKITQLMIDILQNTNT